VRALITGVGRGIGRELAMQALARGWVVHGTVRSGSVPEGVTAHVLDVTDFATLPTLSAAVGPLDLVINNAGIIGPDRQSPIDMDFEGFTDTLRVNTLAPLSVAQALLPNLRAGSRPRILSISSQMAWMGYRKADRIAYRASKAALNKVMQGLATMLEPEGIPVAVIDPGWVRTGMGGPDADREPDEVAAEILDTADKLTLADTGRFLLSSGTPREF
jgi:NAD(P)-dependent dehydrogenase (short-subunit alcohol dehydrogenase family)